MRAQLSFSMGSDWRESYPAMLGLIGRRFGVEQRHCGVVNSAAARKISPAKLPRERRHELRRGVRAPSILPDSA